MHPDFRFARQLRPHQASKKRPYFSGTLLHKNPAGLKAVMYWNFMGWEVDDIARCRRSPCRAAKILANLSMFLMADLYQFTSASSGEKMKH